MNRNGSTVVNQNYFIFYFQITSLSVMSENPSYQHLLRLFADDNEIESLLDLEGTEFIQNFDSLYLRRNKLKSVCLKLIINIIDLLNEILSNNYFIIMFIQIPHYLLSHSLDRNPEGRNLYLEENRLNCDCNSAKILKVHLKQL